MEIQNKTYCTRCGESNLNSSKFCSACGTEIVSGFENTPTSITKVVSLNYFQSNKINFFCLVLGVISYIFLAAFINLLLIEINSDAAHKFTTSFVSYFAEVLSIYVILTSIQAFLPNELPLKSKPFIFIGAGLLLFAILRKSFIVYEIILGDNWYDNPNYSFVLNNSYLFNLLLKIISVGLILLGFSQIEHFNNIFNNIKSKFNLFTSIFAIGAAISVFLPWYIAKMEGRATGNIDYSSHVEAGINGIQIGYGIVGLALSLTALILSLTQKKYVYIIGVIMTLDSLIYLFTLGNYKTKGSFSGSTSMGELGNYSIQSTAELKITPQYGLFIFLACSLAILLFSFRDMKFVKK